MEIVIENSAPVLFEQTGRLGQIVLNRPRALNALNHEMVLLIADALDQWESERSVDTILIRGAGERGLCAGGDIVSIYYDALSGGEKTLAFWRDEYALNARIARYPKPVVTLMDGVVLGGGVGISAHASHRVVTERSRIGMPETAIGFVPDVGGLFLLSRAPGELGTHAALTGTTVSSADAIAMRLADHFVHSADLPALIAELSEQDASAAVAHVSRVPPPSALVADLEWIDGAYSGHDVGTILSRLASSEVPEAKAAGVSVAAKSPTAVVTTLAALRRASRFESLEEALDQDFRVSSRALHWPDFVEGIRAQLVEKDKNPTWNPTTVADVSADGIQAVFADDSSEENS